MEDSGAKDCEFDPHGAELSCSLKFSNFFALVEGLSVKNK